VLRQVTVARWTRLVELSKLTVGGLDATIRPRLGLPHLPQLACFVYLAVRESGQRWVERKIGRRLKLFRGGCEKGSSRRDR